MRDRGHGWTAPAAAFYIVLPGRTLLTRTIDARARARHTPAQS